MKLKQPNLAVFLLLLCPLLFASALSAEPVVINEIYYHPPSEDEREEYLELYNTGGIAVNITSWRLSRGVDFTFPVMSIPAHGFLVVAADTAVFQSKHPGITNFVGGWQGSLSRRGETIQLDNGLGVKVDAVTYATEGDWAVRQRGPLDFNHQGWIWVAEHDGGGKSLELINPALDHNAGQNWRASLVESGTPGGTNSVANDDVAPLILEVQHHPAVPRSTESVRITARIVDERQPVAAVSVFYRKDGAASFTETAMLDDGLHQDAQAGDGIFGAMLPPQSQDTVVEFYLAARDAAGNVRFWPALVQPANAPLANLLYQVDDRTNNSALPFYRLIMTESERAEFAEMVLNGWGRYSNARMNGTFIATQNAQDDVRYLAGIRNRGGGSRLQPPNNFRVEFSNDRPWKNVDSINLNAKFPYVQLTGSVLSQMANMTYSRSRAVKVCLNNVDQAQPDYPMYGFFVHNECVDSNFADRRALGPVNIYRGIRDGTNAADLQYRGEDPNAYRGAYGKETNKSVDDWSDFISLTRLLSSSSPDEEYHHEVDLAVNVDEWMHFFAFNALIVNNETTISSGWGDDYALYHALSDQRFVMFPYDLDTILGQGDTPGSAMANLFVPTNLPVIKRLMLSPEYVPLYYQHLVELLDTTFVPENVDATLRSALAGLVPENIIWGMESFSAARNQYVRSQIPRALTVGHDLAVVKGLPFTDKLAISLHGVSDAVRTRQVLVNDQRAAWSAWEAKWSLTNLLLQPGINRILIQSIDATESVFAQTNLDVWCDPGPGGRTVSGNLATNSTWNPADGPYHVSGELVVPKDVTLRILPGTTVYFQSGASLTVRGQFLAEGTAASRIRLTRAPGETSTWAGLLFLASTATNRLAFCDIEFGDATGHSMEVMNAPLELQNVTWTGATRANLVFDQATLRAEDCVFCATTDDDEVRGTGVLAGGYLLFQRCTFPKITGRGQALRWEGNPTGDDLLQCFDSQFQGGGESGLMLAGGNAYVEGNRIEHFQSSVGLTGAGLRGASGKNQAARIVAARNLFADNDRAMLICSNSYLTAHNNTLVRNHTAGIAFAEPSTVSEPGQGAELIGNIFDATPVPLAYAELVSSTNLLVQKNFFSNGTGWPGEGNLTGDPLWALPADQYRVLPESPAKGSGANGLDMGLAVPAGVMVKGWPISPTPSRELRLSVWGPGITRYNYRLDDGPVSNDTPASQTLVLTGLADGTHTLAVQGRTQFDAESVAAPPAMYSWVVDSKAAAVLLNEICVWNTTNAITDVGKSGWVELRNQTAQAVDLSGMSLSDDPNIPTRFVFPEGSRLPANGYLVLSNDSTAAGTTLNFSLSRSGQTIYLFAAPGRGSQLLDSIAYGYQLPGLAIGRMDDGSWQLTQPTPGAENRPQPTGHSGGVKINEWLAGGLTPSQPGFIELYNPASLPVNLEGLFLSDQPITQPFLFGFPPLSFLGGKALLTLWEKNANAEAAYRLNFNLSLDQGTIGLSQSNSVSVDHICYGPQQPGVSQGRNPDGGLTFQYFDLASPGVANSSLATSGSNTQPPASVMINEVLVDNHSYPDPIGTVSGWIELYNPSAQSVDLSGMGLTDRLDGPQLWTFSAGTSIPAQGFLCVACNPNQATSANNCGFGLAVSGDAVYLLRSAAAGSGILDGVVFGFQSPDLSLGRDPANGYAWRPCEPTPGGVNRPRAMGDPRDLRINEWMANPESGADWLEVFNGGTGPVDMGGLYLTDDLNPDASRRLADFSFIDNGFFGYRQFFADGKSTNGADHLAFKLSSSGEAISLFDARANVIDRVVFGSQKKNQAEGRIPDGATNIERCVATPGRMNYLDTDADGLPDFWEMLYGLDPLRADDARLDSDGDGFDNYTEYISGTDPRDAQSHLQIASVASESGGVNIRFMAVAGKAYSIEYSSALNGVAWNLLSRVKPRMTTGAVVVTDKAGPGVGARFYRLTTP